MLRFQTEKNALIMRSDALKEMMVWKDFLERFYFENFQKSEKEKRAGIEDLRKQLARIEGEIDQMAHGKPDLAEAERAYEERKRQVSVEAIANFEKLVTLMVRKAG